MTAAKILVVIFAIIIIVLVGVLFFYNPAHAPLAPAANTAVSR